MFQMAPRAGVLSYIQATHSYGVSSEFVSWASTTLSGCWWLDSEPQLAVCFEQAGDAVAYELCWTQPSVPEWRVKIHMLRIRNVMKIDFDEMFRSQGMVKFVKDGCIPK
jgi:hypothetical protein